MRSATAVKAGSGYPHCSWEPRAAARVKCTQLVWRPRSCCRSASVLSQEIKLACAGKGPRNKDSAGVVLCAAAPGKARTISGTIRDDSGKPVAAKIPVTFISWTPAGGGSFSLEPTSPRTISADAGGRFTLPVRVTARLNVKFEAVADEKLGVSDRYWEDPRHTFKL